ncbi:MAG TPA: hypothetical protein VFV73_43760 [Streptosporangiaceae bacterium]|nr:hypothetical protein [Streptosporangiaceae bacterium]
MPPDWRLLADLSPGDLQTALLAQADAVLDGRSGPGEDRLLPSLPEPARAIWLLGWLDFEVTQGSLPAYFCNSHGGTCQSMWNIRRQKSWLLRPPVTRWSVVAG